MKNKTQIILALVLIVGALAVLFGRSSGGGFNPVEAVQKGALLLDVRTPGEFANGHIDGATNIPVDQLDGRLAELGDKSRPIVVYCQSGGRSASASRALERAGFINVHNLGPMSAWPGK